MYEQVEKPKENKSRAVANAVAQKKSSVKQGFGFVDNRSEADAQRKLQEMANNNRQVKQERAFQEMIEKPQIRAEGQQIEAGNMQQDILESASDNAYGNASIDGQPIQRYVYLGAGSTVRLAVDDAAIREAKAQLSEKESAYLDEAVNTLEKPIRARDVADMVHQVKDAVAFADALSRDKAATVAGTELYSDFETGDRLYGVGGGMDTKGRGIYGPKLSVDKNSSKGVIIDTLNTGVANKTGVARAESPYGQYLQQDAQTRRKDPFEKNRPGKHDFSRLCKRGIDYTTASQGKHIRFILDNFDVTGAPEKSSSAVTLAELRHTFRQFLAAAGEIEEVLTADVQNIKFYLYGKQVPPPWVTEPELWHNYEAHLKQKHPKAVSADLSAALPASGEWQATDTSGIEYYTGVQEQGGLEWYRVQESGAMYFTLDGSVNELYDVETVEQLRALSKVSHQYEGWLAVWREYGWLSKI